MPLVFTRRRPRRAGARSATRSTRRGVPTRRRSCPPGSRCGELAAGARGRVDVTAIDDATSTSSRAAVARRRTRSSPVGARTHWEVGGAPVAPARSRCARPRASSPTTRPTSPSPSARARPVRRARRRRSASTARSARSTRAIADATVGGVLAVGLSGHRRLRYGPAARPGARGALRHRRRPAREGRRAHGQERDRLRPARGCSSGRSAPSACSSQVILRCQPLARRRRSGRDRPTHPVRRCAAAAYRPSCIAWDGTHDARAARGRRRRRRTPSSAPPALEPVAGAPAVARRARTGAASRCRPAASRALGRRARRRRRALARRGRRRHRARRGRRPRPRSPAPAPLRTRAAAGCCARRARPASTASACALPNRAIMAADPRGVRPDGQAQPGRRVGLASVDVTRSTAEPQ